MRREASPIINASKPTPAITPNRSPLKLPTSMRLRTPPKATSSAPLSSCGMSKLLANRFDVPAGSTAIGTSGVFLRATVSSARCTVPSPPQSKSRSGSVARAAWTASGTFLLFITSCHPTSAWPRRPNSVRSSGRPPPSFFLACATTAIFTRPGMPSLHDGYSRFHDRLACRAVDAARCSTTWPH